jgi:hypothetical protein
LSDPFELVKKASEISSLLGVLLGHFVAVIHNSREFIITLNPQSQDDFYQALKFAAFTSLLNFLIWSMLLNVDIKNVMLITDTIVTYLFWLSYGLFFHWCSKMVKGCGNWQGTISSFLYLTAFFPIIHFVSIPHEAFRQELMEAGFVPGTIEWAKEIKASLLGAPLRIDSVSWLLGRIGWLFWLVRIIQVCSVIHKLSVLRSVIAVVLGFALMLLCQSTFQNYVLWLLWDHWAN